LAGTYNIEIDQGSTFSVTVVATDDSSNTNVLTGATAAKAQIRETYESETVLAEASCAFAANNASLTIVWDETDTINLNQIPMVWDLRITYPTKVEFLLKGKVKLNPTVTRD
jgi:hypothetical protein